METKKKKVFPVRKLDAEEYFAPGHRACEGCGEVLALRLIHKALGPNVIVASATGCMEIISSPFPYTSWEVPWIHVAFENTAAVAGGIEAGLKVLQRKAKREKKKIVVVAMAGDGGTADIGLQALSGAMERGHDFIFICYDNEAYMNTGVQRSSLTPLGASTTTSPAGACQHGQTVWKKNMMAIAAAHYIPYIATVSPSYPMDLVEKVTKAANIKGPAYIHALSVCPPGWGISSSETVKLGRLAVETGVFPLYEIEKGKYRVTVNVEKLKPVEAYLQPQARFRHIQSDLDLIARISYRVQTYWERLKAKAARA
ncbi:MAG TPA: pyruvate synthase subunit beta [Firmicutes bacterium]|jgi:pyruvate ferredoxin oxidoreductase beta subunit|nr:pyruvate synthase subunit beta [Bacillota bacterium]